AFSNSNSISDSGLPNYPDMVRHNSAFPQYTESGPWHFVDRPVDPKTEFNPSLHCKQGQCVVAKIEEFKAVLADKSLPKERRQEALVFLVHLVGDIHQPLHCATRNDTGGNDLKVKYLGQLGHHLNLHSVWDGHLVNEILIQVDPIQTAAKLNESITDDEKNSWQKMVTKQWMMESYEIARTKAYRQADGETSLATTGHPNLDQAYIDANRKVVAEQLKKGGLRLAKVLNDALAPTNP